MKIRTVAKYIVLVTLILLILLLLVGHLLGQPMVVFVETGSMDPTLEPGDGYIAVPAMFTGEIEEGDVILFEAQVLGGGDITTHRVEAVRDDGYITKGDANPFTDQDGEEPIVSDGQILSVAVQINGQLLVIPQLGVFVEGVSSVTDRVVGTVFSIVGLDAPDTTTIGIGVLIFGLVFMLFSSVSGSPMEARSTDRSRRSLLERGAVIIVILTLVVVIPANASMLLPSGVYQYEIVSSTSPTDEENVIEAGQSADVTYVIQNSGHLPVVVFLEPASDGIEIDDSTHSIPRRSSQEVAVTMHAPEETGVYNRFLNEYRYLGILPTPIIVSLHNIHPMAAIGAINALLIVVVVFVGVASIGTGNVRVRSRSRNISLRDRLRRLF